MRTYLNDNGEEVYIGHGIGGNDFWFAEVRKPSGGSRRLKTIPTFNRRESAQDCLDGYAKRKGWAVKADYSWMQVGIMVDYHSIIGGPVTSTHVVRSGPELLGGHTWVLRLEGKSGCVACEACTPHEVLS
jgi:hypothetical protein